MVEEYLVGDLMRLQVTREATLARGAECAAHGTPDLPHESKPLQEQRKERSSTNQPLQEQRKERSSTNQNPFRSSEKNARPRLTLGIRFILTFLIRLSV
jgi:hypothetical protein